MITQKQLEIFCVFAKNPFREFTLKQIKEQAGEKSNNALAIAMNQFKKESLINEQRVGRSSLYTLNFNIDLIYYYIALANYLRLSELGHRTIRLVKQSVSKHTKFYSVVVFGSYAMQAQNKDSDIDVAVFIENGEMRKQIQRALNAAEQKSVLPLDGHVISNNEFLEMLREEEENLGKQIARKHLACHNHQIFYALVQEGIKNGFRV